ncbi:Hypothetical predicted protein [Scomber scombrus]|uniref:Uncharacterized protein n=2 Tax=Scomber scombrus TaxID=13677 RepID=A0AAV1QFM3_SCOSC
MEPSRALIFENVTLSIALAEPSAPTHRQQGKNRRGWKPSKGEQPRQLNGEVNTLVTHRCSCGAAPFTGVPGMPGVPCVPGEPGLPV